MRDYYRRFVIASALLIPGTLWADGFGLGIHGGVNLSDLAVESTGGATVNAAKENTVGVVAGVHLELGTDQVMIRPEANYSVRGYKFAGLVEVDRKYLEIPVLFRFGLLPGPIQPFVEIGPQLGLHLSDDVEALGGTLTATDSETFDLAGVAGAGLRLGLAGNLGIDLEARYVFGVTDQDTSDDIEVKTRGFQLLAGLTLRY